jgi:hypothetical protein
MVSGTADVRVGDSAPFWVVWAVVGLVLYGAVFALVLLPRVVKERNWRLIPVQWAGCLSSFLIAWVAWFLFDLPGWLLVVGIVVSLISLVTLIISGGGSPGGEVSA